jgi:hypothetical protein
MLVFSPHSLPRILDALVTNFQPSLRNPTPANSLYMLTRFACLTCDHTWLEDLIVAAADAIEETFFVRKFQRCPNLSHNLHDRVEQTT